MIASRLSDDGRRWNEHAGSVLALIECMEKAGSQRQPTCTSSPDPSMLTDRLFADSRYHTLPNQRRSVLDKTALLNAICGKS
ncbi:hypothetical protein EVAR_10938_1 [Eumeta japonica]|uniref:Uncharacterized protein n=1 Tax=Eumeta variegata TaxID=151549 RepID=A0A4C1U663_EUMVA|nr:hypothetical protein EVAR_10938_1 [Eumeta japonica]